jgi:hypothetical protein
MMGVKQPKIENNESIKAFLTKAGALGNDVYHVDSVASYNFWSDQSMVSRLIDLRIYNSKGEMLKKLEQGQCTAVYTDQIAEMNLYDTPAENDSAENISSVLKKFKGMNGERISLADIKPDEFIACISFTMALGNVALDDIQSWTTSLRKNKSAGKIRIIYMNMDMHESWGIASRKDPRRIRFDY